MSKLLIKPAAQSQVHQVTPQSAGWSYVGFSVHDLAQGQTLECQQQGRELCIVILTGTANITVGEQTWLKVGGPLVCLLTNRQELFMCQPVKW